VEARAAKDEMRRTRARFDACSLRKTRGGFDAGGAWIDEGDPGFLGLYLTGYRDVLSRDPRAERRIRRAQALDPDAALRASDRRRARSGGWWGAIARRSAGEGQAPPP
jgi:hypothetical protein